MGENLENQFDWIKPRYSELTMYLTALTCAFLFISHSEIRGFYYFLITGNGSNSASLSFVILTLGILTTLGFLFSIVHAFVVKHKTRFEKISMGIFVIGANSLAGINAGLELLPSKLSLQTIFPLFNILTGYIMLNHLLKGNFEISDDNVSVGEVLIATLTLLIVFLVIFYFYNLTWTMTFSICMFYSSTIIFLKSLLDQFRV